jgi:DNA-directed RNA polymerase specialized sigma24 family protein
MIICKTETNAVVAATTSRRSHVTNRPDDQGLHPELNNLVRHWSLKLAVDLPEATENARQSVLKWLVGPQPERLTDANDEHKQLMLSRSCSYRYQILRDRYWQVAPAQAYQNLVQHLSKLFLVRSKVRTWIATSRDRRRRVADVLQEVIQDMLRRDRYLQDQIRWIGECTSRPQMRNLLMLATIEEYCFRTVRNQPLIVCRFFNYLQRSQREGMTYLPKTERVRFVSTELNVQESDDPINLLDGEAIARHHVQTHNQEQQVLREAVQQKFLAYLEQTLGELAACWLKLHLQGFTQEEIAHELSLSSQVAYRLREKVRLSHD